MQSQLEWGRKKFIKLEMKREGGKRKTGNNFSRTFRIAWKGLRILLEGTLTIQCFCYIEHKVQ